MSRVALLALLALSASGCATIMHGTNQQVGFSSTPSQAVVKVDGVSMGSTPIIAKLSRKKPHVVRLELDGYQPYETTLTKSVSGWVWGNLVFGGLPGLIIDAATGGLYDLSPDQVQATLGPKSSESESGAGLSLGTGKDALVIRVVLVADPSWKKIGQLERE